MDYDNKTNLLPPETETSGAIAIVDRPGTALAIQITGTFMLPSIIIGAGPKASKRFVEFFTVPIRNKHTRQAYLHATCLFLDWCDQRGMELETIEPIHVAAYVENHPGSPPTIKQHMAAIRMMFSWMVEKGVLAMNPAREVKTEKFSRSEGKTPAFTAEEITQLFGSIDTTSLLGQRDRAFLAVMAYTFARVSAVASLKVKDYVQLGRRSLIRLNEKGGKERDIPCHHLLEQYLDAYLVVAGVSGDKEAPLFRSIQGKGIKQELTVRPLLRFDAYVMVRRRLQAAGIIGEFSCHSFRATGITNYLENGGNLEMAQYIAGHADSRTTKLYDRRGQKATLEDIERIRY
ncbi:MAG: tyrosine-type recombinase/integrase [Chthonomonadales bacterium]